MIYLQVFIQIFILCALLAMAGIAVVNTLSFPRLKRVEFEGAKRAPKVSLLVPARNEADNISPTVKALLSQDYPDFELILLDDQSTDGTAEAAKDSAAGDPRFRLIFGQDLPPGWTGKNWACQQLGEQAQGELLVFTDADVRWEAGALKALVWLMQRTRADSLTVWPTQITQSWAERLVVPMMMFTIIAYLPELCLRYIPWPVFAAANGQCLAFRRAAYDAVGGHAAVKGEIVEDIRLAQQIKSKGMRMVESLGEGLIWSRMYRDWRQVRQGFGKNILAGHGGRPMFLLISWVFHWLVFLLPWLWLAVGFWKFTPGWPEYPLVMAGLGLLVRLLSAAATRGRLLDSLALPVSVVLMGVIAGQALWWHYRQGGPTWKGRTILNKV